MPGQDRGTASLGLLFKRGNGLSPETFTTVAEVNDVTGPNISLATTESTHYLDTWKGIKPVLLAGGTVKISLNFIPTDATQSLASGLLQDIAAKTLKNFQIVWPDGSATSWQFAAYVIAYVPKAPIKGMLSADITVEIDGIPAFI